MVLSKQGNHLVHSQDSAFESLNSLGAVVLHLGIYRWANCNDAIAIAAGHILPPQNHKHHSQSTGAMSCQFLMCPTQR